MRDTNAESRLAFVEQATTIHGSKEEHEETKVR
jgi:hypothetical protein